LFLHPHPMVVVLLYKYLICIIINQDQQGIYQYESF